MLQARIITHVQNLAIHLVEMFQRTPISMNKVKPVCYKSDRNALL